MNIERKIIMNKKDLDKYLSEMRKYTERVSKQEISSKDSLNSLIKAGICNKQKKVKKQYSLV